MLLKDKIVVLTGGTGWLGQEFVKAIVEQGGAVIIADINPDGEKIAGELRSALDSEGVYFKQTDITSQDSLTELIHFANTRFSRIDALINNAYPRNKNYGRKFEDVTFEDFAENTNSHLGGYFLTSQQFLKYFGNQGYGNVISISSIYGVVPPKFDIYAGQSFTMPVEYAVIKSSLIMLTKYMAKYYKGKNIRVNCISPGGIFNNHNATFTENYKQYCLNKGMLDKSDISGTVLYLLSDYSKYVNGQNIIVDDGFSL
jgi:NAD(P)-dependent dehydrogenase (short-subunit alcohol dehydrogenase family)